MRGLTPLERELLAEAYADVPSFRDGCNTDRTLVQLHTDGRVSVSFVDGYSRWDATDLGRLALRVCPVGEP